jgi:phospholipase C
LVDKVPTTSTHVYGGTNKLNIMNEDRRAFIKKASLLSGAAGLFSVFPAAIQKALAIDAKTGSTYLDAEHVVFLMQENRSFDHCFGTLKGVRGFNDPRALRLADGNPIWKQSNAAGKTYAPFRLNLKDTKSTWMSSLPHSWENQVDALNGGKNDNWLDAKKSGNKDFQDMPLTMGYYNREDLPFYYALADAFTVCDQHFCSSLTGTSPNRLFFWSGTIRAEQQENSKAHVWNDEIDHKDIHWTTFPERLEDQGVSWKTYQNELSIPVGFEGEEADWLSNFTDNDLEFFKQFNVRLHPEHLKYMERQAKVLPEEIKKLKSAIKQQPSDKKLQEELKKKEAGLAKVLADQQHWTQARFDKLSEREKSIHKKAFVTNHDDPDYHSLVNMKYEEDGVSRDMKIPKGDVLHQFRKDVETGTLPTVSWLVPPCNFSDHPGAPWYGAWYISEVMDILTKNEEVFKKTIFIITYDENDGYFDHVPPFLPPHTEKADTGKASKGMDTRVEFVSGSQEQERGFEEQRESAIGLGFRVPMLVVSPWTKGGWVNSQVFDHTSNLQFLEHFLSAKTGKQVQQPQISDWRRTVCGDLSSVFRTADDEQSKTPEPLNKEAFLQSIHNAKFKALPSAFKAQHTTSQEQGIRPSNALPYQLEVNARYNENEAKLELVFEAKSEVFGKQSAGAPFIVYMPGNTAKLDANGKKNWSKLNNRHYAVKAGDQVSDEFPRSIFEKEQYHVEIYGPNGFYRVFKAAQQNPQLVLRCISQIDRLDPKKLSGNLELHLEGNEKGIISIVDNAYKAKPKTIKLDAGTATTVLDLSKSFGWYDFSVTVEDYPEYLQRFAGKVETGKPGYSDPFMGGLI